VVEPRQPSLATIVENTKTVRSLIVESKKRC